MRSRVEISLTSVTCRRTEDLLGGDEFFVVGVAASDDGQAKAVITSPISIRNGETKAFTPSESVVFDAILEDDKHIAVMLIAKDEDITKDWRKRPEWLKKIETSVLTAEGGGVIAIVTAVLAGNPVGWALLGGVVGVGLALGMYFLISQADDDDQLGYLNTLIPAAGAPSAGQEWLCAQDGANYTVRYNVTRTPIRLGTAVRPMTVPDGQPTSITVSARDGNRVVSGDVYIDNRLVGTTDMPISVTLSANTIGFVAATGYPHAPFSIGVVRRTMRVSTQPSPVTAGAPTRMTVTAIDSITGTPIDGSVRLLDANGTFPTNVPFDVTLGVDAAAAVMHAMRRTFIRPHHVAFHPHPNSPAPVDLDLLFDNTFDWSTVERDAPKGVVTAVRYDAGAVKFEVV
jgi:hypothetical protein